MFEAAIDGFCGAVGGAAAVEEGEHVDAALLERPTEAAQVAQRGGNSAGNGVDHGLHHGLARGLVGVAVGGDDALVDAPGRFNLDVPIDGEQVLQARTLLVGGQVVAGA